MSVFDGVELAFVTGKGGVGKSTVALAAALAAARDGRRVVLCEVAGQARAAAALRRRRPAPGARGRSSRTGCGRPRSTRWWRSRSGPGARSARGGSSGCSTHSNAFAAFVNAAPGARELVAITKAWELGQRERWVKGTRGYDLVVLDGPASGHGVGMLRTPHTFAEIARVGPIATQARKVAALLEDPARSALVAVALPAELSVSETLDLEAARGRRGRAPARRRGRQRRRCRGASARPTSIACSRATARSRRRWPRPRAASTGRPARSRASCAGCAATRART